MRFFSEADETQVAATLIASVSDHRQGGIAYRTGGKITVEIWSGQARMRLPVLHKQHTSPHLVKLTVKLPAAIAAVIDAHITTEKLSRGEPLFGRDPTVVRRAATTILTRLNAAHGTRLTLCRISACLYRRIANNPTGGEAVAIFLTGQPENCGYEPATYTALFVEEMDQVLQDTWRRIGNYAELSNEWTHTSIDRVNVDKTAVVGSRLAPTENSVKDYLAQTI